MYTAEEARQIANSVNANKERESFKEYEEALTVAAEAGEIELTLFPKRAHAETFKAHLIQFGYKVQLNQSLGALYVNWS